MTWRTTLDEPAVISARFRDGLMYVSTLRGLSIYDVEDPRAPEKIGALDLPHFENEDVDLGGDVLLISNDPSEGQGRLYTVSIEDPAKPTVLGSVETGYPDAAQGIFFDFINEFSPVPIDVLRAGTGHTASCLHECQYAWLAGTAAGIDVYDLRDPAKPVKIKNLPLPEVTGGIATHDVQFDRSGLAWVAGFGGTAAYDVTDPLNPVLKYRTDASAKSTYLDQVGLGDGKGFNDFIHHNSGRLPVGSLAAPRAGADPEADSDVVLITEEDYTRPGCAGAGSFQTWKIGEDDVLHNLDQWMVETDRTKGRAFCSAHYFDERDGLVAQGWYEQGTRFLDVSDPSDIRQVGYWIPDGTETWGARYPPTDPTGRVVYSLDLTRGIDVIELDRPNAVATLPAPPKRVPAGAARGTAKRAKKMLRAASKAGRLQSMATVRAPASRRFVANTRAVETISAYGGLCRLKVERTD